MVLATAQNGADREILWRHIQSAPQGEYRDMLILVFGLTGDQRVVDDLVGYLKNVGKDMNLRARAARALGEIRDPTTVPILVDLLLNDPAYVVDNHRKWKKARHYVVRRSAKETLMIFRMNKIKLGPEADQALLNSRYIIPDEFMILDEPLP